MEKKAAKELELYVHIPFCRKKCRYCDFLSMPAAESVREAYMDRLAKEIRQQAKECRAFQAASVFIGGGTPSLLEGEQIQELMEELRKNFQVQEDAEITLECNPGTLTRHKLSCYRSAGINRLSLGLQSADDRELKLLGRIHTYEDFLVSFDLARKTGFSNINVDLIFSLPGQTVKRWEGTLKKALSLKPEHISAYSLIVEEGTPFYRQYAEDEARRQRGEDPQILPSEEQEREMYALTLEMLEAKGYRRYEISNYAQPGKACRHNIGYWRLTPYLGLGLGSASFLENVRFSNTRNLTEYLKGERRGLSQILDPKRIWSKDSGVSYLSKKERIEEFMFLGLRMTEGVKRTRFFEAFGVEPEGVYGTIIPLLLDQGLLAQKEGRIFLTEEGIAVSNYVLSQFLLDD